MRTLILLCAAMALFAVTVGTTTRTPEAQTGGGTYEACRTGEETISATALPETGTLELEHVGDETEDAQREPEFGVDGGPAPCADGHYNNLDRKVYADLKWYFNPRTIPDELSRKGATRAVKRGTANITGVHDSCRIPDRI